MMPGTGACALPDVVKLSRHMTEIGCGGVLMLPPFYYKGVSDEGIYRSIAEVIPRVGDDRLRVYLYHIPPFAQLGFSHDLIERLISYFTRIVAATTDLAGDWDNTKAKNRVLPGGGVVWGN